MGRSRRQHANGCIQHVTLRGNHAAPIFDEPGDYHVLSKIVGDVLAAWGGAAHAFCWMTNHIHLLLQAGDHPAGVMMRDIAGRYSRYWHAAHNLRGQLFDRRYFAEPVTTDQYLVAAICYIHLNPVRAGIVSDPREYGWSGHRAYLGEPGPKWLRTDLLIGSAGTGGIISRESYVARTLGPDARGMKTPFHRRPERQPAHVANFQFRLDGSSIGAEELVARACAKRGVSLAELRAGAWDRRMVRIRVELALELIARHGLTQASLAAATGCTPAALARAIARYASGLDQM